MIALCEGLLVQAKIEAGVFTLRRELIDISGLARDAVQGMRPIPAPRNQQISLDTPQVIRSVSADPTLIRQVLTNLLSNASRFTSVRARLAGARDRWTDAVPADTGAVRDPIMMLTALSQPEDVITGLEHSAGDYVTKAFPSARGRPADADSDPPTNRGTVEGPDARRSAADRPRPPRSVRRRMKNRAAHRVQAGSVRGRVG